MKTELDVFLIFYLIDKVPHGIALRALQYHRLYVTHLAMVTKGMVTKGMVDTTCTLCTLPN